MRELRDTYDGRFHVVAQTHPLREANPLRFFRLPGRTVAELLPECGFRPGAPVVVYVDDRRIEQVDWATTRPREGETLVVRALASGGGGGQSSGKQLGRIVALIALAVLTVATGGIAGVLGIAVAPVAGGAGVAGATLALNVANALVTGLVVSLVQFAIFPPPGLPDTQLPAPRNNPLLTGTRNTARPYGRIRRVYGKRLKVVPDLMAEPWIEHRGPNTYLRMLFCFGRGPLELANLRIGQNPLFKETTAISYTGVMKGDGYYKDVEIEIRKGTASDDPITLYATDTHLDAEAVELRGRREGHSEDVEKNSVTRRTQPDVDEFTVELTAPEGLYATSETHGIQFAFVNLRIEYRAVGASTWTRMVDTDGRLVDGEDSHKKSVVNPQFWAYHTKLPATGQYEVKVSRLSIQDASKTHVHDKVYWTGLRTFRKTSVVPKPGLCVVAMRIRQSDQLNGAVDQFAADCSSVLRVWNGSAFVTEATGNAAAAYLDIFQTAGLRVPAADDEMDLVGLKAAMVRCANTRREVAVEFIDETVWERARVVAATMRAGIDLPDGKYGLLFDDEPSVSQQTLSPRNTWGFRGTKLLPDLPHALKVRYKDPAKDGDVVEEIVYADGYSKSGGGGTVAATVFESMEFIGYCNPTWVWKDARYLLAVGRLRDRIYETSAQAENLACRRGSFVKFAHDVIDVGLAYTRVKGIVLDGSGNCTHVDVEGTCPMEAGKDYGVVVRRSTSLFPEISRQVVTVVGDQSRLQFSTAIPAASAKPAEGELLVFGILGEETVECLVRAKIPAAKLSARMQLVPLARDVYDADTTTRPSWAVDRLPSEVTTSGVQKTDVTNKPTVTSVTSTAAAPKPSTSTGATSPATTSNTSSGTKPGTTTVTITVKPPKGGKNKPKAGK